MRRRKNLEKMTLALQQNSFSSMGCLKKCFNIKVEIAALEVFIEPEEAEVCLRYILKHAKRGSGFFGDL